jgi:pimeloyl-[acyl-carrier protein] methyl ester esterase
MRLVFLNGWAASSEMLKSFESYLPASYELIVLDNIYQFELADIVAKIDEQITSNTVLLGWSLGGMLALYYAHLNESNHHLKALVLLNSSACFLEKSDFSQGVKRADFEGLKQVIEAQDSKALLRLFGHLLVEGSVTHKEDRRLLKQVFNENTLPSWAILSKGLEYLEALDLRGILSTIKPPSLFVLGQNDALISPSSKPKILNKNFEVEMISGMGHFPFGSFAEKLVDSLVNYIRSLNECY